MEEEGSENCMSWQERIYWSHFQTTQFCQILPRDFNHHLVIPKKFAGNMCYRLPRKAFLKGPNGATWKVELKGDGDELRFLNGWGDFVNACSLKENDLLIFKHTGNSHFDVLIFDSESFCEKESVYFIRKCGCAKINSGSQQEREREKWIVIRDQIHDTESIPSKRPRKDSGKKPIVLAQSNGGVKRNVRTQEKIHSRVNDHDEDIADAAGSPDVQLNTSNENEELGVLTPISVQQIAPEANGRTPTGFIQASAEAGNEQQEGDAASSLTRPNNASVVEHDPSKEAEVLAIQTPNSVQLTLEDNGSTPSETPFTSVATEVLAIQTPNSVQLTLEDNGSTQSETPFTSVAAGRPRRKRKPVTSSSFPRLKNLIVKKKNTDKGSNALSIQTPTSVQESALRVFESTPEGTLSAPVKSSGGKRKRKVVASSSSVKQSNPSRRWNPPAYASNRRMITEEEKVKAIRMAEQELTDGSFLVVMPPSAVYKKFFMSIPANWVLKHIRHLSQVTLRIGTKTWTTRFLHGRGITGGLSPGWKKFSMDNCLEQFDVCLFKPSGNDGQGIILDVSIFRVVPEVVPLSLVF